MVIIINQQTDDINSLLFISVAVHGRLLFQIFTMIFWFQRTQNFVTGSHFKGLFDFLRILMSFFRRMELTMTKNTY